MATVAKTPQDQSIDSLQRKGWRFGSWISAHDPAHPEHQVAVMMRNPRRGTTEYCEVEPDGTVR